MKGSPDCACDCCCAFRRAAAHKKTGRWSSKPTARLSENTPQRACKELRTLAVEPHALEFFPALLLLCTWVEGTCMELCFFDRATVRRLPFGSAPIVVESAQVGGMAPQLPLPLDDLSDDLSDGELPV